MRGRTAAREAAETGIGVLRRLACGLLSALLFLPLLSRAYTPDAREAAWLAEHPVVRVLSDAGAPPFDFLDEQGRHVGLVADYLAELSRRTGLRFEWSPQARRDQLLEASGASLLVAYGLTPADDSAWLPVRRELARDYPVVVRREADQDFAADAVLAAPRLALVSAYAPGERYLRRRDSAQTSTAENFEPALVEVALGNADLSIQGLAVAQYLIRARGLNNLRLSQAGVEPGEPLHWWVPAAAAPLASLIERAWDEMPPEQHRQLRQRWLGEMSEPEAASDSPLLLALGVLLVLLAALAFARWWQRPRRRRPVAGRRAVDLRRDHLVEQGPGMLFELEARADGLPLLRFVSQEALRVFGVDLSREPDGMAAFLRAILPEHHSAIEQAIRDSGESGQQGEVEYRVAAPEGLRWLKSVIRPYRNPQGSLLWSGVTVDITAQKLAEAKSELAERRLRDITDNIPGVVYQIERDSQGQYRFNFASASILALRGMRPEEAAGDGEAMFRTMHEDDRERIRAVVERSAQTLEPYDVEYRVRMPDGRIEWMHGNANPVRLPSGGTVWNGFTSNVSRIKATERKLEETERFIRDITDNLPGFVYQLRQSADGGRRYISFVSAGVGSHGVTVEEALGEVGRVFARIAVEDQPRLAAAIEQSALSLTPFRLEYRLRLPNGLTAWMRTQAAPQKQPDGSLVWNGMASNVSEEMALQAEAKRAEQRLQTIADTLPGLVYQRAESASGEVAFPFVGHAVQDLFGVSVEDVQRNPSLLSELVLSEDERRVRAAFDASRLDRSLVQVEFRVRLRDGRLRWLRTLARPQSEGVDSVFLWNGFTQDISVEKEAQIRADSLQRRLVEVTANVPCVVFQLQRDFEGGLRLLFVSDSIYALTGVSREEAEADIGALLGLVLPEEQPMVLGSLEQAYHDQKPMFVDFRFRGTDGAVRWLRGSLSVPRREDGGLVWSGAWQDITDIKELQQQLDEAKRVAESANRLKSEFLANMSHEIRTPMNAIIGLGQLALGSGLSGRQQDYVGKIVTASQSLLGIINDILDLSKIEAGKMGLERAEFDLNHVLDHLAGLMNLRVAEKGLELGFELAPGLPTRLIGDPLRLGQVLTNLIGNAVKFSASGEIRLRISERDRQGRLLRLGFEVIDQGIGLSQEQIQGLFESFVQADASTTRKYGGTGLGLSISRNLVRLMGGEMSVVSEPGQGSRFSFEALMELPDTAQPHYELPRDLQGLRVLVVDDSAMCRELLSACLNDYGCAAEPVASGAVALEKLAQAGDRPYALAFIDFQMPGLSGIETVRRLRRLSLPRPPALVMCAAFPGEEVVRTSEEVGVGDFLSKPQSPASLFHTTLMALGRAELARPVAGLPAAGQLHGLRILLADDSELNLEVARAILESEGASVQVAHNGLQVLEQLAATVFDVLLLDLQMPELDGLETVRRLRADPRQARLPVIAMTGKATAEDRQQCLQAGMDDFLAKPIDRQALFAALLRVRLSANAGTAAPLPPAQAVGADTGKESSLALLDSAAALVRLGGNRALYGRLLARFHSDHRESAQRLATALAAGATESAQREAHSLKGVAANLGARRLSELAARIELALREEQLPAPDLLGELYRVQTDTLRLMQTLDSGETATVARPAAADLAPRLERLAQLLEAHDAEANDYFGALAAELAGLSTAAFARLRVAVESYETESAREALRDLIRELNLEHPVPPEENVDGQ
ncbi:MAG: PAS domain-containing protein [Stagnimonas sp.]|nr:PAS domain-containing protein [Stagnimonas sp.]